MPLAYFIGVIDDQIITAFGLNTQSETLTVSLSLILVSPNFKDEGVGVKMMKHAMQVVSANSSKVIDITASHISSSFLQNLVHKN